MNPRTCIYSIILILIWYGCTDSENRHAIISKAETGNRDSTGNVNLVVKHSDTVFPENNIDPYDSLRIAKIDTGTLAGKREWIMNLFLIDNEPMGADFDTLFDLNYDDRPDYVIGYYGPAGTGLKHRVKVYLFDKATKSYKENELLSEQLNPSFLIKKKRITGFYLGNGGGGGLQLDWLNKKWTVTKRFQVSCNHANSDSTVWEIEYPLQRKTTRIIRHYTMVPPEEILETDFQYKEQAF